MHNSLESSKFFPFIAWTTVICFAVFTYTLTTRLQTELANISDGVQRLEQKINEMDTQKVASTTNVSGTLKTQ